MLVLWLSMGTFLGASVTTFEKILAIACALVLALGIWRMVLDVAHALRPSAPNPFMTMNFFSAVLTNEAPTPPRRPA